MRKFARVLVFAVVTVLAGAAHAVPLRITEGFIGSSLNLSTADWDTRFSFGGDGFAANGNTNGVSAGAFSDLSGGENFFAFDTPFSRSVRVGALTCSGLDVPAPSEGSVPARSS